MKKEFDYLVSTLEKYESYVKGDDVDEALIALKDKIEEVEKRIICAVKSNADCTSTLLKFADGFQDEGLLIQTLNHIDFETLQRGAHDVDIALDINESECITENWYGLFRPTPTEVASEREKDYDFPEEVYTIGSANNTRFVADVYESTFIKLLELGAIICENDDDTSFVFGEANYIVKDDSFIPLVENNRIDYSKVPIRKKEVFMTFESSWGNISCDEDGNVLEVTDQEEIDGERNYLHDIGKINIAEYLTYMGSIGFEYTGTDDIQVVGWWDKDNTYNEPDTDFRKSAFEDDQSIEPPTMQCRNTRTFDKVKNIIQILSTLDDGDGVDGETFEYIVKELGFKEFLLRSLFSRASEEEINYLLSEKLQNGKSSKIS